MLIKGARARTMRIVDTIAAVSNTSEYTSKHLKFRKTVLDSLDGKNKLDEF